MVQRLAVGDLSGIQSDVRANGHREQPDSLSLNTRNGRTLQKKTARFTVSPPLQTQPISSTVAECFMEGKSRPPTYSINHMGMGGDVIRR